MELYLNPPSSGGDTDSEFLKTFIIRGESSYN